jgi:RNA 2',3'-cyclic 3'-phosphodiesterase
MIRAFLAVGPSPELQAKFAPVQQELKQIVELERKKDVRISWVQPAKIHLTLKFLGDMDAQVIEPLRMALERTIGSQMSVSLPLERLGAFPRPHSPRVLWLGPSEDWEKGTEAKRIAEIHEAIEQACEGLSFLREAKPFSPHLTLARIKAGERQVGVALAKHGVLERPLSLGFLAVESVVLMQSELKQTGSVYTKVWEVRIEGGGQAPSLLAERAR